MGLCKTSGYPEMEEFLVRHVAGTAPLPFEELFAEVGISYQAELIEENISLGGIKMLKAKEGGMVVMAVDENNDMIKEMGLRKYDILVEWNGKEITGENGKQVLAEWAANAKAGEVVEAEILREAKKNKTKKLTLSGHALVDETVKNDVFTINEKLTDKQRSLRVLWINQ